MDTLATQMDDVLGRLERAGMKNSPPKLNEVKDAKFWFDAPGAPKPKLANEKPKGETGWHLDILEGHASIPLMLRRLEEITFPSHKRKQPAVMEMLGATWEGACSFILHMEAATPPSTVGHGRYMTVLVQCLSPLPNSLEQQVKEKKLFPPAS